MRAMIGVSLCVIAVLWSAPASGAPLTYVFSGLITDAIADIEMWVPTVEIGTTFEGQVTYDLDATVLDNWFLSSIEFRVGDAEFIGTHMLGTSSNGFEVPSGALNMSGRGSWLQYADSINLHLDPEGPWNPVTGERTIAFNGIGYLSDGTYHLWDQRAFLGTITTFASVPEPPTALLLLVGTLIVMFMCRHARGSSVCRYREKAFHPTMLAQRAQLVESTRGWTHPG